MYSLFRDAVYGRGSDTALEPTVSHLDPRVTPPATFFFHLGALSSPKPMNTLWGNEKRGGGSGWGPATGVLDQSRPPVPPA